MALFKEDRDFGAGIEEAARMLGLHSQFVEKDYWVTQTLRILYEDYPGHFIFKGGTSLSKGFGLIERFSEDVDVLVVGEAGDSARVRERKLADISSRVAERLGLQSREKRPPGRGRDASRGDLLTYAPAVPQTVQTGLDEGGILLETGFAGGTEPSQMVRVTPMLCDPLDIDPSEFEDTQEFQVRALEPVRTLLEKVCGLHHLACQMLKDPNLDDPRCGRHYWDIARLLEDRTVEQRLEDRVGFAHMLRDVELISSRHFGGCTSRPEDGFAHGPAFDPPQEIRARLEARYDAAAILMPRTGVTWPSFGSTLQQIARSAHLL